MKTLSRLAAGLLLAVSLLGARPAAAQFHLALGAHAGYSQTKDAGSGSFIGGGQLRLRFLSFLGAEALAEYRQTTYQSGGVDVLQVKDVPVQLSAMLYVIPAGPLQLYLLGGFGCHLTRSEGLGPAASAPTTDQTKWAPQAGAGVEIWTSKKFFISGDIRYVFLDIGSVSDLENALKSGTFSANYWQATAGLNYKF
ncbi:MAG TPA: outer membrane beta-barrel protein [Thermoanaerobaculia bacterium]|nr:outer membrane beta-barrel protein [Thermoanaerobaculia bacterium]HQR66446.1 outer membrane beta-barrel protein [Thermoanaerobaculia bacterium]